MQTGNVSHKIIETVAGSPACGVHVDPIEALHDFRVIRNLIIRYHRFTETFDLHVAAVIRTEGNGRINDVRNEKHSFVKLFLIGFFQFLKCGQAFIIGLDGGHIGVDFSLNGGFFFLSGLL